MTIDAIEAAADRLRGHAVRTPLLNSPFLDEIAGRRVLVGEPSEAVLSHRAPLLLGGAGMLLAESGGFSPRLRGGLPSTSPSRTASASRSASALTMIAR